MTIKKWATLLMGIMEGLIRLEAGLVSMKWEDLDEEIIRLERYLQMTRGDLERIADSIERRRLPEGLPLLITRGMDFS